MPECKKAILCEVSGEWRRALRALTALRRPSLMTNTFIKPVSSLALGTLLLLSACAASGPERNTMAAQTKAEPMAAPSSSASTTSHEGSNANNQALEVLWQTRMAQTSTDKSSPEFALGPGDVLQVSIPQIPQLANRVEKVSENSTISLPLLGEINVAGMTQDDLLHALTQRTAKYVHHPQVDVLIQHTETRQVAVIGAVRNPGRYSLASKNDTIMTMIGRAGGMMDTAASRIILLPASVQSDPALPATDTGSGQGNLAGQRRPDHQQGQPAAVDGITRVALKDNDSAVANALRRRIVISTISAQDQRYLDLPAKPGDVILIPTAGQVTVQGWVDKPGAFPIPPGMTVLSAIAAAGGAVFTQSATLLREQDGRKVDTSLDLPKLKSGEQTDPQVQSGDVIIVERSAVGAVPYTLYFIFQKVGIGIAAAPFL